MKIDWHPLTEELSLWRRAGLELPLWWRDDDAVRVTPALDQLLALAETLTLPVHLAIIPQPADRALATQCAQTPWVVPVVHGWTHMNHAPDGAKKAEFNHPRPAILHETDQALTRMRALFGADLLPMFVPPWNRIHDEVVAGLATQGYRALSTFTPRSARQVAGLVQINTHIDPIHWKAGGGLVPPDQIIAQITTLLRDRREGRTDLAEPLGLLTHHLVHDAAIWTFTRDCLTALLDGGAIPCNLMTSKDLP